MTFLSTYTDLGVVEEAMVVGTTEKVLRRILLLLLLLLVVLGLTMGHRIVSSCTVLRLNKLVRLMGRLLILKNLLIFQKNESRFMHEYF